MALSTPRTTKLLSLLAVTAALLAPATPTLAQSYQDTPLMVVRFNQPRLNYQQSLYNVLTRALETKPDVFFNVIALVPQVGNPSVDQKLQADAQGKAGGLVGEMVRMGIPQNRLRVTYQKAGVEYPEVHVFVQ